tara:strand:+ start:4234 stop:4692 length:459 start_codon:yes stop_codon:yes gene_type:complete
MKVLGIRIDPQKPRYAVVEKDGNNFSLLNATDESRLVFPANIDAPDQRANWLFRELERIIHAHPGIDKVCIKTNEYTQNDTKAKRGSAHLEGVVLLFCAQKNIPVDAKIYASLATNSASVQGHAENRVGKTDKYWDKKMADAIVAAWMGARS